METLKSKISKSFVVVLALLACAESTAGTPKTLPKGAALSLAGKTVSMVLHEPRDINIFGMKFLGDHEDFVALKAMLGDDLVGDGKGNSGGGLVDFEGSTDGYRVRGASVADPSPRIARQVQDALESSFGMKPMESQPPVLAATPVSRLVPKTDVGSILAAGSTSDVIVDVQTYGWQVYRVNAFSDLWFAYISRMTIVDVKTRAVIVESTCSFVDMHARSSKPYLLGFLGNDKEPLAAELVKAGDHCLGQFLTKSLQVAPTAASGP